jgi:predicted dehydrogenase
MNPSPQALQLGFIGGALNSAVGYTHWVSSQLDGRWQVVAGCFSCHAQVNRETAEQWRIEPERLHPDWQTLVARERERLDAVVVLTPTPDHADIVCGLLRAGIPVICEKAMAADLAQSESIHEALLETRGFLAVTYNYSGYPMVRDLRRHVLEGTLGRLLQLQVEFPSDGFIQPTERMHPQAWRLRDGQIPTILLDLAVHVHHLAAFLSGATPASVNADFHHFSEFAGIVDDAYLWVEYGDGLRGSFWVSKTSLGHRNGLRLRLFGDRGSAEWVQEEAERLHIYRKDSSRVTYDRGNAAHAGEIRERFKPGHPAGFVEAFANLYADIAEALGQHRAQGRHDSPYVYGWRHAHQGLMLLEAAARSHRSRQWVSLGESDAP